MVVFSLQGVLFFSVFMQFFDMVMAQVNSIPFLMEIYIREFRSGCYRLSAFYVAKNLSDVIYDIFFTFFWCCALYWPIGFGWYQDQNGSTWENFWGFYTSLLLITFIATGAGYTAAFIVPDPQAGFLVALMLLFPFLIVAGMLVNLNSLPAGFQWLAEISYLRFGFAQIMRNQWDHFGPIPCSERDLEYNQCMPVPEAVYNCTVHLQCSNASAASNASVLMGPFPTGNHALLFGGYAEDAIPGSYPYDDRDIFRMFCALVIFRVLGMLAIFTKAKPPKGGAGSPNAPDAQAEADQLAADKRSAAEKGEQLKRSFSRDRTEIHLQWKGLGMTGDDDEAILSELTGEAKPGEVLAIIGPSGSGKSCLLNCLAGKQTHSGTRLPAHSSANALQTAYMYQEDLFLSDLTVREQLLFQAKMRMDSETPSADRDARVDEVLAAVGLTGSKDTLIGVIGAGISGGERKRLSFAEQILTDPSLIFADEPTSGLDSAMAENVMEQLRELAQGEDGVRRTVVCSIHQPSSDIYSLVDKLLLIVSDSNNVGRTAFFGTPAEALDFFEKQSLPCPTYLNPPDHYMRCIGTQGLTDAGEKAAAFKRVSEICDAWKKGPTEFSTCDACIIEICVRAPGRALI